MGAALRSLAASVILCAIFFALFGISEAEFNQGDLECVPAEPDKCICSPKYVEGKGCVGAPNKFMCPCKDVSGGGTTPGVCVGTMDCKATATSKGGAPMDPSKLLEALKSLMDALKGKQGDKGSPDNKPPDQKYPDQYPTCTYNAATKTYSPIPCKNADGSVNYGTGSGDDFLGGTNSGATTIADALLKALGGSVSGKISEKTTDGEEASTSEEDNFDYFTGDEEDAKTIGDQLVDLPAEEDAGEIKEEGGTAKKTKGAVQKGETGKLESSLVGDIFVGDLGATIFARSRDPESNTEVAGFYGGGAFNASASQSLVGRMCASRPWAGGFLAKIIPESFFDGLCTRAGYQVGRVAVPKTTSGPAKKAIAPKRDAVQKRPPPVPIIHPEVDIWAEPSSVRLGTRTYIFWTSSDVLSCKARGPSFEQNSLSGGASTVPLSAATTFTIVCLTAASTTVEDSVTVRLAL